MRTDCHHNPGPVSRIFFFNCERLDSGFLNQLRLTPTPHQVPSYPTADKGIQPGGDNHFLPLLQGEVLDEIFDLPQHLKKMKITFESVCQHPSAPQWSMHSVGRRNAWPMFCLAVWDQNSHFGNFGGQFFWVIFFDFFFKISKMKQNEKRKQPATWNQGLEPPYPIMLRFIPKSASRLSDGPFASFLGSLLPIWDQKSMILKCAGKGIK